MAMLLLLLMTAVWRGAECEMTPPPSSSPPPCTACGPCLCCDSGQTVNCSSRSLTAVPHMALLPSTATTLLLHNNSIPLLQPSGFKGLPSLHNLDLSHNLLTNITAGVFEGLGQLLSLNLSYNQLFFGSLSSAEMPFVFLTSLERLNLGHNKLEDVSKRRGLSHSTLQWLSLCHNGITSRSQSLLLNNLLKLTYLDLSFNYLHTVRGLLYGMNSLQTLDLRRNKIPLNGSSYPVQSFEPLKSTLQHLDLHGNCKVTFDNHTMRYPDKALSKLTSLRSLSMDGLPLTDFGSGFHNMTSLSNLSLSGMDGGFCYMKTLTDKTLLSMPASLRLLDLSRCALTRIDKGAFRPIRKAEVLYLSSNMELGFDVLGEAMYSLQGSALRFLYINSIILPYTTCVIVTPHTTRYFKNTSLEVIHARNNRLETFCEGALTNMPDTLRFVEVSANIFSFGSYLKDLGSLKTVTTIINDGLMYVPPKSFPRNPQNCRAAQSGAWNKQKQCQEKGQADDSTEMVWTPDLEDPPLQEVSPQRKRLVFTLPPSLDTYVSKWSRMYYKILDVEFNPNNSLRVLNLNSNLITTWIGPVRGLNKLEALDMGNSFAHNVSKTFFDSFPSLKWLNISRNDLRVIIEGDTEGRLFQPLSQLETLHMTKNYLNQIPSQCFTGLTSLKTLDLSRNEIFSFDINITLMQKLSLLDLSYNHIHYLPQFIMDHLDHVAHTSGQDVTVNMTFNPIACTCEHIAFLTWIQMSPVTFPKGNDYACRMSNGNIQHQADIFDVIKHLQETCSDKSGVFVGAVSCFICLMIVLVAAVAYRYRWKLRYLYYASRLFYSHVDSQEGDDFIYDAFVSYSSENNDFVHGQLREELETRAHLRLNIHNRDFTPGRPIPSNIVDAVQKSRHTLVVLTRDLLESDWCHYEMQMATMEASFSGRDVLIFLLYEEVPSHELPRDVFYNLQASTYIAYPRHADPPIVRDFWARLVQALQH